MSLSIPGISGENIIGANDFTGDFRRLTNLRGWYTLIDKAVVTDVSGAATPFLVPRAGAGTLSLVGTSRFATLQNYQVAHFPSGTSDRWVTPSMTIPSSRRISMSCLINPFEGFGEPWGLEFDNGSFLWLKPSHGANTGLELLPSGGSNQPIAIPDIPQVASETLNYVNVSVDLTTGQIWYQVGGSQIYTHTHAAIGAAVSSAVSVKALIGVGRPSQAFVGRIAEFSWFGGLLSGQPSTMSLITEYMLTAWGV